MPQKTKPSRRLKATIHKRFRPFHKLRLYSFSVLALGLLGVQLIANIQGSIQQRSAVLAYATNVSLGDLLAATNQARSSNGLSALTLNSRLSSGAQAKANDMVTKDYWSHTSPDGTQPWQFFTAAGYSYTKAGENLAYGFGTSGQVIDGWMNSSGHRANILGSYADVGFGVANGANYQGSENTVVVAFYATPQSAPAPAPTTKPAAPTTPAQKPAAATPSPAPTPAPASAPASMPAKQPKVEQPKPQTAQKTVSPPVQEAKKVTTLETALGGQANWATYASLGVVGVTSLGFAGTHVQLVRRGWKYSKHYILVHPALDTAVLAAVAAAVLTSASGFIK